MNEYVKANASRYGTLIGALAIAYTLVAYLIDLSLFTNFVVGILFWIVILILLIVAVRKAKVQMGGFISFKNAFSTFIMAYIISALISTLFSILLFNIIDPEAGEEVQEMIIASSVEMMEKFGAPEDQIEAQVEAMEEQNTFSIGGLVKSFFTGIIGYAIVGLIVAAFMKKSKPEYAEEAE